MEQGLGLTGLTLRLTVTIGVTAAHSAALLVAAAPAAALSLRASNEAEVVAAGRQHRPTRANPTSRQYHVKTTSYCLAVCREAAVGGVAPWLPESWHHLVMSTLIRGVAAVAALVAPALVGGSSPASAAGEELALSVTTGADAGPGSYRQAMIDASNSSGSDTITFDAGLTVTLASDVTLTGAAVVTVNGNGSTISGAGAHQILNATAPVTFDNITLESAASSSGGAVQGTNTVVIKNSTVRNNVAGNGFGEGGAVHAPDVVIMNSDITSSVVGDEAGNGGALFGTNIDLIDSTITGLNAARGAAVYGEDVDIIDSTIEGNTASQLGGGVFATEIDVANSTLHNNTAGNGGGAVNAAVVTATNSVLSGNTATNGGGGAIRAARTAPTASATVINTLITGNSTGGNGGAVSVTSAAPTATITDSVLIDNDGDFGGAVSVSSPAGNPGVTINRSSLLDNTSNGFSGGAVDANTTTGTSSTVNVFNSTFTGNAAGDGGGVRAWAPSDGGLINLGHASMIGNTASSGAQNLKAGSLTSFASVVLDPNLVASCDITGSITSNGYNYDDDGTCGFGAGTGDTSDGPEPLLSPLRNNGDPIAAAEVGGTGMPRLTYFPLAGSPLIDAVPTGSCSAVPELDLDERGVDRPFGSGCDIGANEAAYPAHSMSDVTPFYEGTVRWITSLSNTPQILSGYPNGTFGQSLNITRGQMARLYYRAAGAPDVTGLPNHGFGDVTAFYDDAVTWAKSEGLFDGYPDNTFRQSNPITRGNYTRSLYAFVGSPT